MWKKMFNEKYRFYLVSAILFVVVIGLRIWARIFSEAFLRLYTDGINRWMIKGLSRFFGMFSVSVFEVLILVLLITGARLLFHYKWRGILVCVSGLFFVYSAFMIMWGLNYERPSVAVDFGLDMKEVQVHDLQSLYLKLIELANVTRGEVSESDNGIFVASRMSSVALGFNVLQSKYGVFGGQYGRYKEIATSDALSHAQIAGIYGVFTGEPNVNVHLPDVARLFTVAHESAHQRGVAHEDETNFVAFMACLLHPDVEYRYSGYFNALMYVRDALIDKGELEWVRWQDQLIEEGVVRDFNHLALFWNEHESWVTEWVTYGTDLFMNFHRSGEYVRMVNFLVAYYNEFD
jgi:hypothetical protein